MTTLDAPPTTVYRSLLIFGGRTARAMVLDAQQLHRTVMAGFLDRIPDGWDGVRRDLAVLYSTRPNRDGTIHILVQSPQLPDWRRLDDGALTTPAETWAVDLAHTAGQQLHFELHAAPSRTVRRTDGRRQRRTLHSPEEQLDWLQRHGERGGYRIDHADTGWLAQLRSEEKSQPAAQRVSVHDVFVIRPVRYTGQLIVTDPDLFSQTLVDGVGPGKAYGCGLLLTKTL
jgi:CRISPR system Cascade subunit CasE